MTVDLIRDNRIKIIILLVLIAGTALRVSHIGREFTGNFGQRQVYNAWVARNFVKDGINIKDSRMDVLDFSGKKTPSFRDFPLVIPVVAFLCRNAGGSIEFWGRLNSVIFFIATFFVLYFWLKYFLDEKTITFSLFAFSFFPMSIVYHQSFILEPSALFFFCAGLLFYEKYQNSDSDILLFAGSILVGLSFATRLQFVMLLGVVLYSFYRKWGLRALKEIRFYLSSMIIFIPAFLWQLVAWKMAIITETKSSLAVTLKTYIFTGNIGDMIYFDPDFYRKIFDDFSGIIFNPIGLTLVFLGLVLWEWRKDRLLVPIFLVSVLAAVLLVPEKFYKHDYYYFPIIIPGSILAGYSLKRVSDILEKKYIILMFIAAFTAASLRFAWNPAFVAPVHERNYIYDSGFVKKIVPEGTKIVVLGIRPVFLYYCDRMGWSLETYRKRRAGKLSTRYILSEGRIPEDPVEILKHYESKGAEYMISFKSDPADMEKGLSDYIKNAYVTAGENGDITVLKKK